MISYQDYATAHRKQQLEIWALIESGELQKAVDVFAAGIQYGESKPETCSTKRKRKKRGIFYKFMKWIFTRLK